jgi:hypothetical protein
MPIVAVVEGPGLSRELYEESVRKLTGGKSRVDSPADWPVPGLLAHIAGQGAKGWRVVDVWESEQAFQRFGEKLLPVLKEAGIQATPEVYPAHTFVSAAAAAKT